VSVSSPWNLEEVVHKLLSFRGRREWEKFHYPKELAAAISIEADELQELFLWRKCESASEIISDKERLYRISDELADITTYLLILAYDLNIDLAATVQSKILKNEVRYNVEKHKGVAKKADS
jgi:NTP pyrophosphatase (non-canonical NTP hydrolase)